MYRIVNKIFYTGPLARTSKKEKEQGAQRIS